VVVIVGYVRDFPMAVNFSFCFSVQDGDGPRRVQISDSSRNATGGEVTATLSRLVFG